MRKYAICAIALTLLLLTSGCSNKKLTTSEAQLARTQAQNDRLQAERDSLQAQLTQTLSAQQSLEAELKTNESLIEQQQILIKDLDLQAQKYKPAETVAVNPPAGEPVQESVSTATTPTTGTDYQTEYERARKLYDQKSFKPAGAIYRELLQREPDHKLASNCQYWLGECSYGQKQYETALVEFQKVFTFPRAMKADAAQLKIGVCYMQLRKFAEAREELNRLLSSYPASEYVPRARALLDQIP